MKKIAVIVITYRRPQGLQRLLVELAKQKYRNGQIAPHVTAIVVDNDKEPTASSVVQEFVAKYDIPVNYIHETRQGIPVARNTGLAAVPEEFDFFCFIDDDEWPSENWLDSLLTTQSINNADCVLGAVIPVYPENAPNWILKSRIFDSWRFPDNARLTEAASNNVLVSNQFVRQHQHQFDERMRMTGGSDYLFFKQANSLGLKIYWSDKAPVYEDVPMTRLNAKWLIQRQFRLGNTFAVSERLDGSKTGLVLLAAKGLSRVVLGALMLPSWIFSTYYGVKGMRHILRGAGMFIGIFGHSHQEYATKSLLKERAVK
jgi:glycosyltransferase involved in cell wall biosynthesis